VACGGNCGIAFKEQEVCPSSPKKERVMTMVIFFRTSVESCGSDQAYLLEKRGSGLLVLRGKGV
jgi:hypothetical protein